MRYLLLLSSFAMGCTVIEPGTVGVATDLGTLREAPLTPGINFYPPIYRSINVYSTRYEAFEVDEASATKDNQKVNVKVTISWARQADAVPMQEREYPNLEQMVLKPRLVEAIKAATSMYSADELTAQREMVKESITQTISTALAPVGIVVDDVSVGNFDFSEAYDRAIEEKIRAREESKRAEEELRKAEAEAKKKIVKATADKQAAILVAEGQAEALRIQGQAIEANPAVVELERINKWNGAPARVIMLGEGGSGMAGTMLQVSAGASAE
jgi:prohibitin 2